MSTAEHDLSLRLLKTDTGEQPSSSLLQHPGLQFQVHNEQVIMQLGYYEDSQFRGINLLDKQHLQTSEDHGVHITICSSFSGGALKDGNTVMNSLESLYNMPDDTVLGTVIIDDAHSDIHLPRNLTFFTVREKMIQKISLTVDPFYHAVDQKRFGLITQHIPHGISGGIVKPNSVKIENFRSLNAQVS